MVKTSETRPLGIPAVAGLFALAVTIVGCPASSQTVETPAPVTATGEASEAFTTPTPLLAAVPSPTVPALEIAAFYPIPVTLDPIVYANLDGYGLDEVIAEVQTTSKSEYDHSIDVFGYMPDEGKWQRLLHYQPRPLDLPGCDFGFGVLNLKDDRSRQLLIRRQCGSGGFLDFEIYGFRGLDVPELLYQSPEPVPARVVIANEQLYIEAEDRLFHYTLDGDQIKAEPITFVLPPSTQMITWWREGDQVVLSQQSVSVNVGDLVQLVHADDKDPGDCSTRLLADGSFLEFTDYPNVMRAFKPGEGKVMVGCAYIGEPSSLTVSVR
jgi:hypothetical protein